MNGSDRFVLPCIDICFLFFIYFRFSFIFVIAKYELDWCAFVWVDGSQEVERRVIHAISPSVFISLTFLLPSDDLMMLFSFILFLLFLFHWNENLDMSLMWTVYFHLTHASEYFAKRLKIKTKIKLIKKKNERKSLEIAWFWLYEHKFHFFHYFRLIIIVLLRCIFHFVFFFFFVVVAVAAFILI